MASDEPVPIKELIQALTAKLSKLDAHAAVIAEERARVSGELAKLLSRVDINAEGLAPASQAAPRPAPKADTARQREMRGKCAAMCVEDIDKIASVWTSSVSCIALGDACSIVLFDDREPVFSTRLPSKCPQLFEQLANRSKDMPSASDVAIGTEDRFYLRFADGKQEWVASDECTTAIKSKAVAKVSFGRDWDDFVVLHKDGSCTWAGLPSQLEAKLDGLGPKSPPLSTVNLGPEGEWCVRPGAPGRRQSSPPWPGLAPQVCVLRRWHVGDGRLQRRAPRQGG